MNNNPPRVLVETWLSLIAQGESGEVRTRAQSMLLGAFDTTEELVNYCRDHSIDLRPILHKLRPKS